MTHEAFEFHDNDLFFIYSKWYYSLTSPTTCYHHNLLFPFLPQRADIAIGPISVMAERENVIDFTVPYYDLVGLTILLKKPEFDYELFKFLIVLDENVWLCIIASYFLFSGLLYAFDKLSPYSYQNNREKYQNVSPEPRIFTIKEGIWFCMMSLTPQGFYLLVSWLNMYRIGNDVTIEFVNHNWSISKL